MAENRRRVVGVGQSLKNSRVWTVDLDCGHSSKVTYLRSRPRVGTHRYCTLCASLAELKRLRSKEAK